MHHLWPVSAPHEQRHKLCDASGTSHELKIYEWSWLGLRQRFFIRLNKRFQCPLVRAERSFKTASAWAKSSCSNLRRSVFPSQLTQDMERALKVLVAPESGACSRIWPSETACYKQRFRLWCRCGSERARSWGAHLQIYHELAANHNQSAAHKIWGGLLLGWSTLFNWTYCW